MFLKKLIIVLISSLLSLVPTKSIFAQVIHKLMTYNILNYPGSDSNIRNSYFLTTLSAANPDILVVQEMTSEAGVNEFLNNVLKNVDTNFTAGIFINGPDSDNAIYYKSNYFTFIGNRAYSTTLRDINEFKLAHKNYNDTLIIYSVHLKASSGSSNENQRLAEVNVLRNVTDLLPTNTNYIVLGDFNIYSSNEPAYQKLLNQSTSGYFIDVINLTGTWNNSEYALYHTQSPRTRQFGGGANGGLDDRFDMILFSPAVISDGGITYVTNSYTAYGNDGLHYNDSINRPPNNAVGQAIANALHYASDHLPVMVSLKFEAPLPVELGSFSASLIGKNIVLSWHTVTEINNYGFFIERLDVQNSSSLNNWTNIGFVMGNGNSNKPNYYSFEDKNLLHGNYRYRLKQVDVDGQINYSNEIDVSIIPQKIELFQNYPNPFNNSTIISFSLNDDSFIELKVFDSLGNEIKTFINEKLEKGFYKINFVASEISSNVYFAVLKSDNNIYSIKLLLLK